MVLERELDGRGFKEIEERERERWKKRRGKETAVAVDSEKLGIQGRNISQLLVMRAGSS